VDPECSARHFHFNSALRWRTAFLVGALQMRVACLAALAGHTGGLNFEHFADAWANIGSYYAQLADAKALRFDKHTRRTPYLRL
jgi:hypothetical protein